MKYKFLIALMFSLTFVMSAVTFAAYERTADNTVPAFTDPDLRNRNGNERVDAGDRLIVFEERGNSYYVRYPVRNGTKDRWVPKNVFNGGNPNVNWAYPAEGDYYIVPFNSSCAIDVPNNWTHEGNVLQIYGQNQMLAQIFTIRRVGNEWYKIIHKDSGHAMNVQWGSNGNGTRLWLYHYDGTASCHWRFRDLGGGVYNIESQLPSNPFLEVQNGNPFNGAVLQIWQQHAGNAAKWTLKKVTTNSQPTSNKTSFPNSIYLTQPSGSNTCTLTSAAMMLRAKAYLNGDNSWSSITEQGIKNIAWSGGLKWSWNYNGMHVSHSKTSGISSVALKSILKLHPEGIVLHCANIPRMHAVWVIEYNDGIFYCSDPLSGYSGDRRPLVNSYLGKQCGSQENVLSNVTAYWFIE